MIRRIELKEETIQTIREIKRIMSIEWFRHRAEVDQLITRVRLTSPYGSNIEIDG